jgi:hypothetical protein
MKQASERHSFLSHSWWDGMGVGWEWLAFDLGFCNTMLDFDIACLLTFVVYRKNESKEAFSLSNGPYADRSSIERKLSSTLCIWKLCVCCVCDSSNLFRPRGPYISHQTPCYAYVHLNPSLIYPISFHIHIQII